MTLHDHMYSNFNISISFKPSITFAGSTGNLGSVRGRSLKAGRVRRLWRQQCLVLFCFVLFCFVFFYVFYPAGAAAGYCFLLVILPAQPQDIVSYSFPLSFFTLPEDRQGLVSYSFLLSSSSFFFFFFLLATHLFHTLPYIWFWPNLLTVTGTLTTTQAQTMVGSEVTMGSLGSKRSFSPKGITSYRIRSIDAWLMHMNTLDPLYKSYGPKNSSGVIWGHGGQKVIFTKKAPSPSEYVALTRYLCICISLINSTKVMVLKNHPGSFGVTGVKRSFSLKML